MLRSISCFLVNRHAAEYGLCMCSDGPRAGLINEFSLPMWHCCDKQIPSQAGPFASGWFCVFVRASSFYDKDTTFPALCLCVWVRWVTRERKTEGGSWLNNSISTWVKLLILPKSSQRELKRTHTLKVSDCVSALNYITRGPTWVRSMVSTGHRAAFRGADGPLIARERSVGSQHERHHLHYKPQAEATWHPSSLKMPALFLSCCKDLSWIRFVVTFTFSVPRSPPLHPAACSLLEVNADVTRHLN